MKIYSVQELRHRFDKRIKLTKEQLETLFNKKLNEIQIRYLEKGIRFQGVWDIETSDFNPLGQFIICYNFVRRDILTGKEIMFEDHITSSDVAKAVRNDNFDFDYRLLHNLTDCIRTCDQVIGHFSTKFDMPFVRSRCLASGLENLIPDYDEVVQGDTWRMMKTTLKAPRNTLMYLSLLTSRKTEKTHVDLEHWRRIYFPSNPKWVRSMKYIVDHCRKDVKMTVKAVKKLEKFNTIQRSKA